MKPGRRCWRAPVWTFLAILLTAGPLGYFGRDIGIFILTVTGYLPLIAAICLVLLVTAVFAGPGDARRATLSSLVVIVLTAPAAFVVFAREHDRIAFLFWSQTHRTLLTDWTGKQGLVVTWDSWGFGGISGDSFLISAPSDSIGDAEAVVATAVPCIEPDCLIGHGKRMAPGFFIVSVDYQ
jgi:hypothetical protein